MSKDNFTDQYNNDPKMRNHIRTDKWAAYIHFIVAAVLLMFAVKRFSTVEGFLDHVGLVFFLATGLASFTYGFVFLARHISRKFR